MMYSGQRRAASCSRGVVGGGLLSRAAQRRFSRAGTSFYIPRTCTYKFCGMLAAHSRLGVIFDAVAEPYE